MMKPVIINNLTIQFDVSGDVEISDKLINEFISDINESLSKKFVINQPSLQITKDSNVLVGILV